jgi:hypothetical protein
MRPSFSVSIATLYPWPTARLDGLLKTLEVKLLHYRHHQTNRMVGAHQIVRALCRPLHLLPLRPPQTYRGLDFLRIAFAHVLLII